MTEPPEAFRDASGRRRMSRGRLFALLGAGIVLLAAVALILIPVISSFSDGQPHDYTSKDYGFSATFPGRPTGTNPATGGDPNQLYVAWQKDTTSLIVQAHALTTAEKAEVASTLLDQRLTEAAALFGGKGGLTPTTSTLDGQKAREARFSLGGDDTARELVFIRDGRLYSVIMVNATPAQQSTFLDSIRFAD